MVGTLETSLNEPIHFSEPTIQFRMEDYDGKLRHFRFPLSFFAVPSHKAHNTIIGLDEDFQGLEPEFIRQRVIDAMIDGIAAVKPDFRCIVSPDESKFFTIFFNNDVSVWGTFYCRKEDLWKKLQRRIPEDSNLYYMCGIHPPKNSFGNLYNIVIQDEIPNATFQRKDIRMTEEFSKGQHLQREKDNLFRGITSSFMVDELYLLTSKGELLPMRKYV